MKPLIQTSPFRCGRNWTERAWRLMDCSVRSIRGLTPVEPELQDAVPRTVIMTHYTAEMLIPLLREHGLQVVLVVRDPRDAMVSYFHWRQSRRKSDPRDFETQFEDLLHWAFFQFYSIPFQFQNAAPDLIAHTLRYESLIEDRAGALRELIRAVDLPVDAETFATAVARTSFHAMTGGRNDGEERNDQVCRKGITGEWRHYFNAWQRKLYSNRMRAIHERLGYGDATP